MSTKALVQQKILTHLIHSTDMPRIYNNSIPQLSETVDMRERSQTLRAKLPLLLEGLLSPGESKHVCPHPLLGSE